MQHVILAEGPPGRKLGGVARERSTPSQMKKTKTSLTSKEWVEKVVVLRTCVESRLTLSTVQKKLQQHHSICADVQHFSLCQDEIYQPAVTNADFSEGEECFGCVIRTVYPSTENLCRINSGKKKL